MSSPARSPSPSRRAPRWRTFATSSASRRPTWTLPALAAPSPGRRSSPLASASTASAWRRPSFDDTVGGSSPMFPRTGPADRRSHTESEDEDDQARADEEFSRASDRFVDPPDRPDAGHVEPLPPPTPVEPTNRGRNVDAGRRANGDPGVLPSRGRVVDPSRADATLRAGNHARDVRRPELDGPAGRVTQDQFERARATVAEPKASHTATPRGNGDRRGRQRGRAWPPVAPSSVRAPSATLAPSPGRASTPRQSGTLPAFECGDCRQHR